MPYRGSKLRKKIKAMPCFCSWKRPLSEFEGENGLYTALRSVVKMSIFPAYLGFILYKIGVIAVLKNLTKSSKDIAMCQLNSSELLSPSFSIYLVQLLPKAVTC